MSASNSQLSVEPISARTNSISKNIFNCFSCHFKPLITHQDEQSCYFFEYIFADVKYGHAFNTLTMTSVQKLKSHSMISKLPRTQFIRTVQVSNKEKNAIVKPPIRLASATDQNCSQIFNTCLQHYIGSCRGDIFRDSLG